MRSFTEIADIAYARQSENSPYIRQMMDIRDRYNGDYVVPGFEGLSDTEGLPPMTPALIAETVDMMAQRAGSVMPMIYCPPLTPGKESGVRSREYANIRKQILQGTWYQTQMKLKLRRAYRHLAGYAVCTMLVRPDRRGIPKVEIRDPLTSYPDLNMSQDFEDLTNCVFIYGRTASWVRAKFPQTRMELGGVIPMSGLHDNEIWEIVEYVDDHEWVIGLLGPRYDDVYEFQQPSEAIMELWRGEHRLGRVPVVSSTRITLDRIVSAISHIRGIVDLMARLTQLDLIGAERAIFPDRYVVEGENASFEILNENGTWPDGRTGEVAILRGAEQVGTMQQTPDPAALQRISMLERNARVSVGASGIFSGENTGSLRTGQALTSLAQQTIDPRIAELQETMGFYLSKVNELILDCWRYECGGNGKKVLFTGTVAETSHVEFVPSQHIESTENVVNYFIGGADVQDVTIQLSQMLGTDALSMRTYRERHPWVDDPDAEEARINEEAIQRAVLASLMQQATTGEIPLSFLALLEEKTRNRKNKDIIAAFREAEAELREMQVQEAPPPQPGQVMDPAAAPGLAAGPMAAMQPQGGMEVPPQIAPPTDSQNNFRQQLAVLNAGATQMEG